MLTNGEQKIFIWIDFSPETEMTIRHGVEVALILEKEICLIYQLSKDNLNKEQAQLRLTELAGPLSLVFGPEHIHLYIALHPIGSILAEMAEEYDALLLVAPKTASKELLPKLPQAGFPFLFVSEKHHADKSYKKIAVPVSYMKKSKDLALWSSYIARHNGAKVSLIKALANFEEDKRVVMSILFSIQRLFKNFHFSYETIETHTPTWKIQKKALEQALCFQNGLLIISFTYRSSIFDRFLGINDAAVIDHSESLSVMCINSQRDLYTLCG
jgi:hypothetical protein